VEFSTDPLVLQKTEIVLCALEILRRCTDKPGRAFARGMGAAMNETYSKPTHSRTESPTIEQNTLDCDHILTYAGGNPERLIRLCGNFLIELPLHMEALQTAVVKGNNVHAERDLQLLRNCLMVFGAGPVSFTAELLDAVRGGRSRQIKREWKRVVRQVRILEPQVQRLMLEMAMPKGFVQ